MVSVRTSALISDARGRIGGVVFTRNKSGLVVRSRIKPLNPRSTYQQTQRAYASTVASHWASITAQQRADWQAYALNTGWTNRLGDVINIGGEAAFVRSNTIRLLMGMPILEAAPTEYGKATSTVLTVTASAATQTPVIAEPSSGFDGETTGHTLAFFAAMPQPGSRDMAPTRFRYLEHLIGTTGNPVSWPHTLGSWPWTYTEGQRITVALVSMDPDRRMSIRTFASCLAEA